MPRLIFGSDEYRDDFSFKGRPFSNSPPQKHRCGHRVSPRLGISWGGTLCPKLRWQRVGLGFLRGQTWNGFHFNCLPLTVAVDFEFDHVAGLEQGQYGGGFAEGFAVGFEEQVAGL